MNNSNSDFSQRLVHDKYLFLNLCDLSELGGQLIKLNRVKFNEKYLKNGIKRFVL